MPKEDPTGSFIILTMGLFIETLRLVAAHQGHTLRDELVHDPSWYAASHLESLPDAVVPFARLQLIQAPDVAPEYPLDVVLARRTSRLRYRAEALAPGVEGELDRLAQRWGHRYGQLVEPARIERLLDWNIEAVFADLNNSSYRDEMGGWIRYSNTASVRARDGLDARCMNTPRFELWLAFHAAPLLLQRLTRPWFARRYRRQIGPVTTLGYLSGPFWEARDAYSTGRFLTHFWLECTRLGYSIHPYGNLVTNRPIAQRVQAECGARDIWLVFKIGRSDPAPESRRRSVEEILVA